MNGCIAVKEVGFPAGRKALWYSVPYGCLLKDVVSSPRDAFSGIQGAVQAV